jgi:hypothetical protein
MVILMPQVRDGMRQQPECLLEIIVVDGVPRQGVGRFSVV